MLYIFYLDVEKSCTMTFLQLIDTGTLKIDLPNSIEKYYVFYFTRDHSPVCKPRNKPRTHNILLFLFSSLCNIV